MTIQWEPKDQPIYQTQDTFQQLVDKLNISRTQLDSDLNYLDSAIGPLPAGSLFDIEGITTSRVAGKTLIDAINEIDAELGPDALNTVAQTFSGAINEIEAVFDASANKIIADNTAPFIIDAELDIVLDAKGNDVVLRSNGTNFAKLSQVGANLRIQSGASNTTAMQFTNANAEFSGSVTLPSAGTGSIISSEISANTVHGAIDEVNARIPNIYNAAGTWLNP